MNTSYNAYDVSHGNLGQAQSLQDQFGYRVAARLTEASAGLPHDISERLRVARGQALAQRKKLQMVQTSHVNSTQGGSATLTLGGGEHMGLWGRFASILPLIALLAGLVVINVVQNDSRAKEVAEVDSALLTDDLPPSAYVDPGFAQYLKVSKDATQ